MTGLTNAELFQSIYCFLHQFERELPSRHFSAERRRLPRPERCEIAVALLFCFCPQWRQRSHRQRKIGQAIGYWANLAGEAARQCACWPPCEDVRNKRRGLKLGNRTIFVRIAVIAARTAIGAVSVRDESPWGGVLIDAATNPAV